MLYVKHSPKPSQLFCRAMQHPFLSSVLWPQRESNPQASLKDAPEHRRASLRRQYGLLYKAAANGFKVFHPAAFVESLRWPGRCLSLVQLLAPSALPRNLLLYVNMSISSSLTSCLDTTLTRLPLTVTRVRKVASTDPCLVFVEGAGVEPAVLILGISGNHRRCGRMP